MSELIQFYKHPQQYLEQQQNLSALINEARQQSMLASLYHKCQALGLWHLVSVEAQRHLISGKVYADKQHLTCFNELKELCPALQEFDADVLLVKGIAYKIRGLQMAQGRLFSDIDLLVSKANFPRCVDFLKSIGFLEAEQTDYDRQYYLNWSHQYPPLFHYLRGSSIDLHHAIIPVTAKTQIDVQDYILQAQDVGLHNVKLPSDSYLFIHAAVHLFLQEETHKLVKDLCELNELGRELLIDDTTRHALWQAAEKSNVSRVIYTAATVLQQLFQQTWSQQLLDVAPNHAQPRSFKLRWNRWVITKLIGDDSPFKRQFAYMSWYIRGHIHKMGLLRLTYHTVVKSYLTWQLQRKLTAEQREIDKHTKPQDAGETD